MIKDILAFQERLQNRDVSEILDQKTDFMVDVLRVMHELAVSSQVAKKVILAKISEEDFCKLRNTISELLITFEAVQGNSTLLLADRNDELVEYTDSILMGIIGLLIEEEIL